MPTRRQFLEAAGLTAAALAAGACGPSQLVPGPAPRSAEEREALRLLLRLSYGPRPGEVERVAVEGPARWLERQLEPDSIDDARAERLVRRIEILGLAPADLYALGDEEAARTLRAAVVLRTVYGERQLLETMTDLWRNHFNVYAGKPGCGRLAILHERDALRPHALGRFRDLLRATATGPAMLVYLDGRVSRPAGPNENYARELLELHTLGVDGGYTQSDVREAARALTGWRVRDHLSAGTPFFDPQWHDAGEKRVLGAVLPAGGGPEEIDHLVDVVSAHPSTASFVATKLCRRFVADEPPPALVARVAGRFSRTGGDIRETMREVLGSGELAAAPPKLRRPFEFAMAALRALDASTDGGRALQDRLAHLGHLPYDWPTPDGFPEVGTAWRSQVLERWRFAFDLTTGAIEGTSVTLPGELGDPSILAPHLLGRPVTASERRGLGSATDAREAAALLLCTPAFQYR